ncbi:MAG: formate--tetrahydrofolate ligase [Caldilineaceae bacterium]
MATAWPKLSWRALRSYRAPIAKYVVVTAITPTPLGEGKSTTTVGLGQGMPSHWQDGHHCHSPAFAGGRLLASKAAAGGGYSQVVPMEQFSLHMTGDIHAVTAASSLLAAMIDSHIYQGNELNGDPYAVHGGGLWMSATVTSAA